MRFELVAILSGEWAVSKWGLLFYNGASVQVGNFYKLSGDEETAVATYLDLIQQFPASPWSWLAWARLEPMPD